MMFVTEPRNWKWMVPAGAGVALAVMWSQTRGWGDWAMIPLGLALICGLAAGLNLWAYIQQFAVDAWVAIRAVQNATPEVRMFEAAKGMHPQTVEALLIHRRALWRIKYIPFKDVADWIFDEAPSVHAGFVDFVLDHSSAVTVMPKHLLSDGSRQLDPEGMVLDRQQYDDLLLLLQQKLICTQALGNQPPKWIPPWNPDLVRRRFGLDGEMYMVEEMGDAVEAIRRASEYVETPRRNGSGRDSGNDVMRKTLEGLDQTAEMKAATSRIQQGG